MSENSAPHDCSVDPAALHGYRFLFFFFPLFSVHSTGIVYKKNMIEWSSIGKIERKRTRFKKVVFKQLGTCSKNSVGGFDIEKVVIRTPETMLSLKSSICRKSDPMTLLLFGRQYRSSRFFESLNDEHPWPLGQPPNRHMSQVGAGGRISLGERWALFYSTHRDLENSRGLRHNGGFEYRSRCKCWAVGVNVQDDPDGGVRFQFRYSLLGIGDDRLSSSPLTSGGGLGSIGGDP